MAPPICLAGIRDVDRFPLCRHFFPHWLSLLCTYTCARRFGYPQDTNGILRMPRYPQDASGILRIRYPQDTAVSSGYRVLRIPARVLGYGVPRIPPPILGICRCPQDAPRVPGRQLAYTDVRRCTLSSSSCLEPHSTTRRCVGWVRRTSSRAIRTGFERCCRAHRSSATGAPTSARSRPSSPPRRAWLARTWCGEVGDFGGG